MSTIEQQINQHADRITHKGCEGEITSNEAVIISYDIISDGDGGWEYGGNRIDEYPFDGTMDYLFTCRKCGWWTEHFNAVIVDNLMTDKRDGKI